MLDSESENLQDMICDYSNEDEGNYQVSPKQQFAPMIQSQAPGVTVNNFFSQGIQSQRIMPKQLK
jgi:hypothetical protein